MKSRISIITLGVDDLARSRAFYADGLGFSRHRFDSDDIVFFDLDGTWLALFARDALAADVGVPVAGDGFRGFTLAHNVASRDEVDAVMAVAERAGATLVNPPTEPPRGGYSGYFADPDGYYWEVAWQPALDLA